jgi:NAD(P)-dependent dehydrogenase (short-subunit alcohol dehydrogenase family)
MAPRAAIVTGGASGIGRGIATRLADDGLDVVIADLRRDPKRSDRFGPDTETPTDELVRERGGGSRFVETDVSDPAAVERLVDETVDAFGRVDALVNNAGAGAGSLADTTVEDWQRIRAVNLDGPFYAIKAAIDHLTAADHGRVVNVASVNALFGGGGAAYAASKAGLVNLTRDVAVEFGPEGVTANAVLPGAVATPMQDAVDDAVLDRYERETPRRRLGTPADVASAVSFFVAPDADWVSGASLVVDGGYTANGF